MKPKVICYFFTMLLVTGMIACGGDDPEPETTQTETPNHDIISTSGSNADCGKRYRLRC